METRFQNIGNNQITHATLALKENDVVIANKTYDNSVLGYGILNPNVTVPIKFPAINYNPEAEYEIEITSINSAEPFQGADYEVEVSTEPVPLSINNIEVRVHTDSYPAQITWNIKGSAGNIVASGGPYQAGQTGPHANTTITHFFTLPEEADCYSIEIFDSNNNGWGNGNTAGIKIYSEGVMIHQLYDVEDFGSYLLDENAFRTGSGLNTIIFEETEFAAYPNPSSGTLNFKTSDKFDLTIYDLVGKTIFNMNNVLPTETLDISHLQKGVYIMKIKSEKLETTEKLIIN